MPPPGFRAAASVPDPRTVKVQLVGELTFGSAEDLDDVIVHKLLEVPGVQDLILDCAEVDAIDSMGLSVLLMVKRRAVEAGARLRLENRTPRLDRMLTLTGTLKHLTEDAVAPQRLT